MKIKLEENLPDRLVPALIELGHDIDTVWAERLNGQPDSNVWNATQVALRFFITQDLDFSDIRRYTPGASARAHGARDRIEYCVQFLRKVLGEKTQHEVAILLKATRSKTE